MNKQTSMIEIMVIDKLCNFYAIDHDVLSTIINDIKSEGYVYHEDIRAFANCGIPILLVASKLLSMSVERVSHLFPHSEDKTRNSPTTYNDLMIILGMLVQDVEHKSLLLSLANDGSVNISKTKYTKAYENEI